MSNEQRELYLIGATGAPRAELYEGREHLVVPVIALMEGVIHAVNAAVPEFVPGDLLQKNTYGWNGRPVVVGHPAKNGVQISANDPKVLEQHKFGTIFQTHTPGKQLRMEAWVDPKKLEALGQHELLSRVRKGEPIEVSVGAFVKTLSEEGVFNGKKYKARWAELVPDHLAFLPKTRGACSIEMGCGAHRAAEEALRAAGGPGSGWTALEGVGVYQVTDKGLVALGGPGSGWSAEAGHVAGSQGGAAAAAAHAGAASAHAAAAAAHDRAAIHPTTENMKAAADATKAASAATKSTGANLYSAKAAKAYSDMAMKGAAVPPGVTSHNAEAAKMHRAAENEHTVAKRWGAKYLEGRPKLKSLKERLLSMFRTLDTPEEAASEEAAELVGYQTLQSLLEGVKSCHDEASSLVDQLIADEEDDPTETPEQEDAEEEVECARLDALSTHCQQMISQLSGALNLIYKMQLPDLPAPSDPRYMEALRAAVGKRNSAADQTMIQQMHDHSVALGADCSEQQMTAAETHDGGVPAEGEKTMTKEERAGLITTLSEHSHSGFAKSDVKLLEAMPDAKLAELKTLCECRKKTDEDLATLKAAAAATPKTLSEEDYLKAAPESIRTLVADKKAQDAARKLTLVEGILKAAEGVYSKEELEAKDLKDLEKLGLLTKSAEPISDFSAARPIPRTAAESDVYNNPPDPYADALKARRASASH